MKRLPALGGLVLEKLHIPGLEPGLERGDLSWRRKGGPVSTVLPWMPGWETRPSHTSATWPRRFGRQSSRSFILIRVIGLWLRSSPPAVSWRTTAAVVFLARRRPALAVGWFWFLGMLVPVIGLVRWESSPGWPIGKCTCP